MDDFLIVGYTQLNTPIYMSELSAQTLQDNGIKVDYTGLYLYETSDDPCSYGIRVLAALPNPEAAYRILDLLGTTPSQPDKSVTASAA